MKELKRLLIVALALTFLCGGGLGAFVGSLAAAAPRKGVSVDRRVEDFRKYYGLDATLTRRVRELLEEHDLEVEQVRREITSEQARKIDAIHREFQERIDRIVGPPRR